MFITNVTKKIEMWATRNMLLFKFISKTYNSIIAKEAVLARLNSDHNILFIGGGACPFSAIALQKLSNAKVTVVDNDRNCVIEARKLAARLGLDQSKFEVIEASGEEFDASGYKIIHLALQLSSKDKVLKRIKETMDRDAKILYRLPKKGTKCLYDNCSMLTYSKQILHRSFLTNIRSTVLLD
jgi:D-arabinose 1-dehydrogenase-like Zn-dependent alcohol dehydrogenase